MNWTDIETMLVDDEGLRLRTYLCTKGFPTIGVGHRLLDSEMSISEISVETAGVLLRRDIEIAIHDLECVFGIRCLDHWSEQRQHGLINMMFQLGRTGFMGFRKMIAAVKDDDWQAVRLECLDSKYAREDAPDRAWRVANMLYDNTECAL